MHFLLTAAVALLFGLPAYADTVIFSDDFEEGAAALRSQWERKLDNDGEVIIGEANERGKVVCISRNDRNGLTFITHGLPPVTGSVRIEAEIQAEQVMTGSRDFKGGQFHAVVIIGGKEVAWPKADFDASFGWTPLTFDVFDLTPSKVVVLRIGLQQGKGKVCVNDVKVTKTE